MNGSIRKAAAFAHKGSVFLHPYSRTVQLFWIFSSPVLVTDLEDAELGHKILFVLSQSRTDVAHPTSWKGLTDSLLKSAGVRSFDAFAKHAKGVDIAMDDRGVVFTPTRNGGPKQAFLHLNDKQIRCSPTEMELMECLRAAFEACE